MKNLSNEEKINRFYLNFLILLRNDDDFGSKINHILFSLKEIEIREIILNNLKGINDTKAVSLKIDEILLHFKYLVNEYWKEKYGEYKFN